MVYGLKTYVEQVTQPFFFFLFFQIQLWSIVHGLWTKNLCRASHTTLFHRAGWACWYVVVHFCNNFGYYSVHVIAALAFNGEFNRLRCCLCAQVIHTCFKAFLPCIKVHRGKLARIWRVDEQVKRLRLADISATIGSHIDDVTHLNFPYGFVKVFNVLRNFRDVLYRAVCSDDLVLHGSIPQAKVHQVAQQVLVYDDELTAQYAAGVNVRGIWHEANEKTQKQTS